MSGGILPPSYAIANAHPLVIAGLMSEHFGKAVAQNVTLYSPLNALLP
ncbi:hypothetical protein EPIR_1340 [Erwinia piriflorinigrans CFBP 5888]|uniref:Uncharacterized protein n=1 Tax=Erwinia piriflorinigrans CFBP 5888 TaxID=1161919 RepID=V5Z6P8_9GAMM|nr:hypothetical protein EPIR_1340 [Erwinia piriflorinigrans CFBP 5888]